MQRIRTTDPESARHWADKVRSIRRFSAGDRRAPYKPLLLLWLIGRHAAKLPTRISFQDAEEDLKQLMDKYRMGNIVRVQYPFVYLGTDRDLWKVEDTNGDDVTAMPKDVKLSTRFLRREATGYLAPDFELALQSPQVRSRVVNTLLEMEFPETLHADILEEVNLGHLVTTVAAPRDPDFRRTVLLAYENQCSFCGFDGSLKGQPLAIDAAHVKMRSYHGPDDIANGMALCVFHHRLFDRGALGLDQDHRILVSQHMILRSGNTQLPVMDLIGATMRMPQAGYDPPAISYINWHYYNLFVWPHRSLARLRRRR